MKTYIFPLFLILVGCQDDNENETDTSFPEQNICGDEVVSGTEECEDSIHINCRNCILTRRLFVTSLPTSSVSIKQIDINCYLQADNAGLLNGLDWISWNSTSDLNIKSKIFQSSSKYQLVNGDIVANSFSELIGGNLQNPVNMDENGNIHDVRVWTGTTEFGESSEFNCSNWTSDFQRNLGTYGWSNKTNAEWTNADEANCDDKLHYYCIEDKKL